MHRFLLALAAIPLLAGPATQTFTGVITDTMCGAKPHSAMMKDKTEAECVQACTKGQFVYALLDGSNVIKLTDQKAAAKFAAKKVTASGVYDEKSKTLKVASIQPAE